MADYLNVIYDTKSHPQTTYPAKLVWKYPFINIFCALISPFIPVRTHNKFLRWSRELMLIGYAEK
jgi:hypothetical protein